MRYIALLFILFSLQLAAQNQTIKEPTYTLQCPKGWDTIRYEGVLAIMIPSTGEGDMFSENINIVSQAVAESGTQDLSAFATNNIIQLEGMGVSGIQRSDYVVGKKKLKGYLITYTTDVFTKGAANQKLWQVFAQFNGRFYVFTYSSVPQTFATYLPQIEKVVKTIVFK